MTEFEIFYFEKFKNVSVFDCELGVKEVSTERNLIYRKKFWRKVKFWKTFQNAKMKTFTRRLSVRTRKRKDFVDITREVERVLDESGISDGILTVFIPHTTCGVVINENWDPTVREDIQDTLTSIAPENKPYKHTEGNADAHIKTAILGNSVSIPVEDGKLPWGSWQGIFLAEFDGPRTRTVIIKVIGV